jgi:hypothetical protein
VNVTEFELMNGLQDERIETCRLGIKDNFN